MNLVIVESPTKVPINQKSLVFRFIEDPRFFTKLKILEKSGQKQP